MEPILEVKDLSVTLGGERVLEDVSFVLPHGEMTAIVGPNGAGKTTLLRALLGLLDYEGEVRWRPGVKVSYAPQRFSVPPSAPITVKEFFLLKSARFWRPEVGVEDAIAEELQRFGLDRTLLRRPLGRLSGGQVQRLLLAWAMLKHPDVLLFDEPTASVDVGFTETIYTIMRRVTEERGTTILLISHDLNIVFRFVQNVLCINHKLFCQGPPTKALTPQEMERLFGDIAYFPHAHHE